MNDYLTVRCAGFVTYCDALVARMCSQEFQAFFFSLIGSPSQVKASSAILFGGETCRVADNDDPAVNLKFSGGMRSCRSRKIGDTVNKVFVSTNYFPGSSISSKNAAVIYGPDMPTVKERAFLRLDAATTIPLKKEWSGWLWEEVLQPEKLYSFGGDELKEAYLISWPNEAALQGQVLVGVGQKYLT